MVPAAGGQATWLNKGMTDESREGPNMDIHGYTLFLGSPGSHFELLGAD